MRLFVRFSNTVLSLSQTSSRAEQCYGSSFESGLEKRCIGTIKSHQEQNQIMFSLPKVGNLGKEKGTKLLVPFITVGKIVGCQKRMRIDYSAKKRCTNGLGSKYFSDRFMKNCSVATTICWFWLDVLKVTR